MPSRFRFQGHAVGAAGQIRSPFQEVIEVQAASALPEIGGYGSGRSSTFRYREILHFDLAHTEVTGSQSGDCDKGPVYCTLIKSTIEGLNVMGMLTADRIVANIVSTYRSGGDGEPSVKLIGTRFENLKIAGIPVRVDLAIDLFDRFDTHASLRQAYRSDDEVRRLFEDVGLRRRLPEAPAKVQRWFHGPAPEDSDIPSTKGITSASLVRKLEPESSSVSCWGHVIHVDGFGVIRLAEIDITQFTRRVTMVQIELGCPVEGRLMMCSGEDGGTEW
ncbi:MAG: hypothetical protein ACRD9L_12090 [Bryobacteraceae bacterium]